MTISDSKPQPPTTTTLSTRHSSLALTYVTHFPAIINFLKHTPYDSSQFGKPQYVNSQYNDSLGKNPRYNELRYSESQYSKLTYTDITLHHVLTYMARLIKSKPHRLVLRAKELSVGTYEQVLQFLQPLAVNYNVKLIVNHHPNLALTYNCPLQVSMAELTKLSPAIRNTIPIGVAIHSYEEAQEALAYHSNWLVYGHVFESRCKPGLTPRSHKILQHIIDLGCPTYAIGGIYQHNWQTLPSGLAGVCIMHEAMEQTDPMQYTTQWLHSLQTM